MDIIIRILRGDSRKAAVFLTDIVRDFECQYAGQPFPQANSALADAIVFSDRTNTRFTQFLNNSQPPQPRLHRLMYLGALSTSNTFIEVFKNERDGLWKALLIELDKHMAVINFFARSRQLPWKEAIISYFDDISDTGPDSAPFRSGVWPVDVPAHPLGLEDDIFEGVHPHAFYFCLNGGTDRNMVMSGSRKDKPMENIKESAFDRRYWPRTAPPSWPANRTYLDHPQNVRNATAGIPANQADDFLICSDCDETFVDTTTDDTGCTCVSWHVDHPCVQVHEYPPYPSAPSQVNKGVITMQAFAKDEIIGEYVGLLLPPGRADPSIRKNVFADDVYTIDLNAAVIVTVEGEEASMLGDKIADVSAGWKGNWTRFINTSPRKGDWNIELEQRLVADRIRILVRTIRLLRLERS
ncbi:hypothetical protein GMDG_00655 [Pseudogymnoascus destructans 20631-21]|uniref:SET domain-containing protein n=1 Tax=Pseudogymnoascus destructans (strain ATCC MYA-4855 / 20631-21) TaxID=658429 RepID=L8G9Z3_PSED2|nr:hypothetical protein GMDG_00655 [Pseudogymnoascus destructans 20631-21]